MYDLFARAMAIGGLGATLAACAGGPRPVPPPGLIPGNGSPGSASAVSPTLPPIPHVRGPASISVVYPRAGALVMSRDSNFIFGSVGTGDATLTINGYGVPVRPNGAFLAWLPVPDSAMSRYDLVAVAGADTVRMSQPVRVEPSRRADSAAADSLAAFIRPPPPFPDSGRFATLTPADSTLPDTDRAVIARPVPGGTYKWFLLPGTVAQIVGRSPGYERIRLDEMLDAWVSLGEVRVAPLPPPGKPLPRIVGTVRVTPQPAWVDVAFAIGDRPPYLVEENGSDLVVTFYSTQASTSLIQYVGNLSGPAAPPDTLVRSISWDQETTSRARYTVHLTRPSYGYLVLWTGGAFVLRVRRSPSIDRVSPLRGLTVAVDAGHPPAGATGPTGLYEPVATLAVAQQVQAMLTARGANVVMTRTTADPVDLGIRPVLARRSGAAALVSIHLNALPDGMNPFVSYGTGTYFFHPHSVALARAVQTGMVRTMGLRDLGVHYDNLALVRPTWMPAVLCEGAFIIIPEQEAALRTPGFQTAYARGVVDGLENYFRGLGTPPVDQDGASQPPAAPGAPQAATTP